MKVLSLSGSKALNNNHIACLKVFQGRTSLFLITATVLLIEPIFLQYQNLLMEQNGTCL